MALRPWMKAGVFYIIKRLRCALNSFSTAYNLMLSKLIQECIQLTPTIWSPVSILLLIQSLWAYNKQAKMNSYETTVSANSVEYLLHSESCSITSGDHTGIIQLIFLPLGRTELPHFWEMKICLVFKHFQKRRFHNLLLMASYNT